MDNAFERARAAYGTGAYDDATLEFLFPQLRESEEEKIRKDLIGGLMWQRDNLGRLGPHDDNLILPGFCENVGKHLAYLEKQKEKPQEELVYRLNGLMQEYVKEGKDEAEKEHRFKCYQLFWDALEDANFFEQKEQKPWKVGANAYFTPEQQPKQEWSEEDKGILLSIKCVIDSVWHNFDYDCSKEELKEMWNWLDTLWQRVEYPQPKQEWSKDWREEDIQTRFAFYTYKDEDGVLYLSNVFVEETSRNHGFGTKILIAAEKVAETIGATTISLKVKQDSPANAWYRKNGYGYVAFEDGYDWLEKNLEYMKPNKQEWSDEDEENFKWFDKFFRAESVVLGGKDIPQDKYFWFKSLRPQNKIHYWTEEEIEPIISDYLTGREHYGGMMSRLRCLKPKSHYKPSEEQKPKQEVPADTEVLTAKLVNLLKSYRIGEETATGLANRIADTYGTQRYLDGLCDGEKGEWKPNEDEERLINTSISFLKDFADKGYENAVECIDWLKSKLNGNLEVKEEPEYYQHFDPDC